MQVTTVADNVDSATSVQVLRKRMSNVSTMKEMVIAIHSFVRGVALYDNDQSAPTSTSNNSYLNSGDVVRRDRSHTATLRGRIAGQIRLHTGSHTDPDTLHIPRSATYTLRKR